MKIKSITLNNYRLYQGQNTVVFNFDPERNIFIISGENGFGKTTFLHSLLWCLYGKLIADIEYPFKKDSYNGGYSSLLKSNLNNCQKDKVLKLDQTIINTIKRKGYSHDTVFIKEFAEYFIEIEFSEVVIPSIPCSSLTVRRGYDFILEKEFVNIYIDGKENELTNEIGPEIFINDFILNKDIARFFFFDSEQIVELAESNTPTARKKLSSAYNEVLGVRKYEDLQRNIESVRLRFRKRSNDIKGKVRIDELQAKRTRINTELEEYKDQVTEIGNNLKSLKEQDEQLQIRLLREGNSSTVEELKRLHAVQEKTQKKDYEYKQLLKTFLDYAPLAICGKLFNDTLKQAQNDYKIKDINTTQSRRELLLSQIDKDMQDMIASLDISMSMEQLKEIQKSITDIVEKYRTGKASEQTLIDISEIELKDFTSIYNYVTSTYKAEFERLSDDYKKNRQILERTSRQISNIESKENDALIKEIRQQKNEVEGLLAKYNNDIRLIYEEIGKRTQQLELLDKELKALIKEIDLDNLDAQKDILAEELTVELKTFLLLLKQGKKASLERRIRITLNALMHKDDFIHHVEVNIEDDCMDVVLFDTDNRIINKDLLSKGEQQLYATSLLKALVDESGIQFPVFIDSPLQKFDKTHAARIISEFYPTISSQVILLPLLEKELTVEELKIMKPLINSVYIIENNITQSSFKQINVESLLAYN